MKCSNCNGDGWYVGHAHNCNGWRYEGCDCSGEQIQCEKCQGSGEIKEDQSLEDR